MPRWRRATVVWLRPDVTRPDLAYLPFEHVNTDMIYATTVTEVVARHKAFVRKWRLKWSRCRRQSGGGRSAALHLPALSARKWKSLRTTNAVERLHEEFKRRIQDAMPAALRRDCLHAVLGVARQRSDKLPRVDGCDTFHVPPTELNLDRAA